ncbi:MAG: 1-phosphofructokinase family hexose kinase [Chloroflexi bacterium]|nr:1-phosphofructokinase family hexose kinase [Chloroflexota bacterium]
MILCLNLNAAIDKTIVVSSFEINRIHRPESVLSLAGGKGCNVARALKTLGEEPVVSGWVGGFAGRFIEDELHQEGIQTDFVRTDFESRTCTSILDREKGTMTEIYEKGESVPLEKIDELRDRIRKTIGEYKALTLSGSMPPGVPAGFYADLIEIARKENVPAFLDSSGDALRKGIEAVPFFIKPNEAEVKSLLGLGANDDFDFAQAASDVSKKYGTNVLLSLGAKGAVAANGKEVFVVKIPRVEAKSAVGSGDCTLAGLVHGILNGLSFEESVRVGVSAGTANTLKIGAAQFELEDFERLRGQVHVSREMS